MKDTSPPVRTWRANEDYAFWQDARSGKWHVSANTPKGGSVVTVCRSLVKTNEASPVASDDRICARCAEVCRAYNFGISPEEKESN